MTTILFLIVLVALIAFVVLRPLWSPDCDVLTDLGREAPASDEAIQSRRDHNIEAMRDLEYALAEGKIDEKTYDKERARLTKEAETSVKQLRQRREDARKVSREQAGTYPKTGLAAACGLLVATCVTALYLNTHDLFRDVSPHATGQIPIPDGSAQQQKPQGLSSAQLPADHPKLGGNAPIMGADGKPDPKAMVARLEKRLASGTPSPKDVALLARSYRVLGREKEIMGLYKDAAARAPDNPDILFLYASSLFDAGSEISRAEADATFDQVLKLRPDMPEALWFKSLILVKSHKIEPAKKILTKLQGLVTDNPEAKKAVAGLLAALSTNLAPATGNQHTSPPDHPQNTN